MCAVVRSAWRWSSQSRRGHSSHRRASRPGNMTPRRRGKSLERGYSPLPLHEVVMRRSSRSAAWGRRGSCANDDVSDGRWPAGRVRYFFFAVFLALGAAAAGAAAAFAFAFFVRDVFFFTGAAAFAGFAGFAVAGFERRAALF